MLNFYYCSKKERNVSRDMNGPVAPHRPPLLLAPRNSLRKIGTVLVSSTSLPDTEMRPCRQILMIDTRTRKRPSHRSKSHGGEVQVTGPRRRIWSGLVSSQPRSDSCDDKQTPYDRASRSYFRRRSLCGLRRRRRWGWLHMAPSQRGSYRCLYMETGQRERKYLAIETYRR